MPRTLRKKRPAKRNPTVSVRSPAGSFEVQAATRAEAERVAERMRREHARLKVPAQVEVRRNPMKPLLSKADAAATLSRRKYDPIGKWLPGSKGGWRVQAVTPEGSIAWVEVTPGGPGGHPKVTKRNPKRRNPDLSHHADTIARLAREGHPEDLRAQAERADEAAAYYQRTGDARKAAWERERAAVLRAAVARIQRPNPMRKNHHIRPGGTFYTPGGRRGTVLGPASKGSYPVRWKDGTLGRVQDTERAAYPAEGSRTPRKRKNPNEATSWRPVRCAACAGDPQITPVKWRTDHIRASAVRPCAACGDRRYGTDERKKNPAPSHRIDTDAAHDRRTGKRKGVQAALVRIQRANDLGFFLDHRGWYQQGAQSHFVEHHGRGPEKMAAGTRWRKYLSPSEAAHLNAFVAGKGRL